MSRSSRRSGFSLVDLLVIVMLLLLTLTLLVPAVQAVQLAGHKQASVNNLKQVCLAIHHVNDTNRRLPPACDKFANWEFAATVHVYLLPYMEHDNVYRAYNAAMGKGAPREATVQFFIAPDDNSNPTNKVKGVQNYAANLRVFSDKGMRTKHDSDMGELKAVESGSARIPATFQDGTSNTIVFATRYAAAGDGGSCWAAEPNSKFAAFFGQNAAKKAADASDETATFQLQPGKKEARATPLMAQSLQKALLVGLADASVRTISADLSAATWNAAVQPNDGGVLGADW